MRSYQVKAGLLCAFIALSAPVARADCEAPRPDILWTYPEASTLSVPPDTVFWAVAHVGEVNAEVDGAPLTPLARDGLGRHQFSPAEDLSEGAHELVVWSDSDELGAEEASTERRISFTVDAQPASSGDVSVSSVTVYPLAFGGRGGLVNPPPDEYDLECSELAVSLEWSCDDIIPPSIARVTYEAEGAPIAYVVQGGVLVPRGCASYWTRGSVDSDRATFRAAAILPTGLAAENAFAGSIEERTVQDTYPERFSKPGSAWCSLRAGKAPRGGIVGTTVLLLAAFGSCLVMRRARRCAR